MSPGPGMRNYLRMAVMNFNYGSILYRQVPRTDALSFLERRPCLHLFTYTIVIHPSSTPEEIERNMNRYFEMFDDGPLNEECQKHFEISSPMPFLDTNTLAHNFLRTMLKKQNEDALKEWRSKPPCRIL